MSKKTIKLKQAFNKNVYRYNARNKTIFENEVALFNLMVDHPIFNSRVRTARKELLLPVIGLVDSEEAFKWEHKKRGLKSGILVQAKKVLLGFRIPTPFISDAIRFTYDYILSKDRVANQLMEEFTYAKWKDELQNMVGRKYITLQLVHTHKDREINKYLIDEDSVYLKVNPEIRFKDLTDAFHKMKGIKKTIHPFSVPKAEEKMRMIWRMRQEGHAPKDIIFALHHKYGSKKPSNHYIDINTQRYKEKLSKLFPLPKTT